jgi:hypothetical protein
VITVRWYLISFNPLNDWRCQHLKRSTKAVEAGLYNIFTRYGKMTMHFYHNEEFILKIYSYKKFFKQGSDETLFRIAFAIFVSEFQLRAYLHAVCLIFTMQTIDNILNNSGKDSFISFWWYIYMKAFIFRSTVYLFYVRQLLYKIGQALTRTLISHSPLRAYNVTHYFM